MSNEQIEINTSAIYDVVIESADAASQNIKRAIVKIPIISEGNNSKFLNWTQETMAKVAHMFRGVPFRYDINGSNEGSHTKDHLSSPFYDVGWTYSDDRGAYYDPATRTVYVQGEVTHPEVIDKLMRQTSDGKREINFASMGALLNPPDTKCSICNKVPFGSCIHARGQKYGLEVCSMIPTNITKALHVALTNDPADKNAVIESAIFQDMSSSVDSGAKDSPVPVGPQVAGQVDPDAELIELIKITIKKILDERKNEKMLSENADNSEEAHKMEDKKKKIKDDDVKESVKEDVEKKTTEQIDDSKEESLKKKKKVETAEAEDKKEAAEDEDEKKKKKPKHEKEESKEEEKEEHESKTEENKEDKKEMKKKEFADDYEFKISGLTDAPRSAQLVETQDAIVVTPKVDIYAGKYKAKLVQELADTYVKYKKVTNRNDAILVLQDKSIEQLEIYQDAYSGIEMMPEVKKPVVVLQDNTHSTNKKFVSAVPEFGGMEQSYVEPTLEVSDMSPEQRRQKFGEFGAFDLCFNPGNAQKYKKK